MSGSKILEGLKDAVAGNFASVTIEGQRWVRDCAPTANTPTARSSTGSEQESSIPKVEGSSPSVLTTNAPVAELVEATDLNSGSTAGSNPAGGTTYTLDGLTVDQIAWLHEQAEAARARWLLTPPAQPALDSSVMEALAKTICGIAQRQYERANTEQEWRDCHELFRIAQSFPTPTASPTAQNEAESRTKLETIV